MPASVSSVASKDSTEAVPPATGNPPLRHWKESGAVPVAVTPREALLPAVTRTEEGCKVRTGGVGSTSLTVRMAALLVTELTPFLTTTSYLPASAVCAEERLNTASVAPVMFKPFLRHW